VGAVAALLDGRGALSALKRALPRGAGRVVACRSLDQVRALLQRRLPEAVVVSPRATPVAALRALREEYPAVPILCYASFRPDDGELLHACAATLHAPVAVEGVDDLRLGDLLHRHGAMGRRRRELSDAPRLLRLKSPLQLQVWELALQQAHTPLRATEIARKLRMSREHLSREFALEAAPNLKRVIDLARVATAAHLLANPAISSATAARLLKFASASHLGSAARRVAGCGAGELGALGPKGVLHAFARGGRGRSRV
jgi:AraC-like DNA-binding protein